jgi:hypothetical protein
MCVFIIKANHFARSDKLEVSALNFRQFSNVMVSLDFMEIDFLLCRCSLSFSISRITPPPTAPPAMPSEFLSSNLFIFSPISFSFSNSLKAANELKLATGPYKAARDAYVAATATYTKSLYE